MLTKEDLQLLSNLIDEKLKPIQKSIEKIEKDIEDIKEDLEEVRVTTNATSEWAEALTEYHFPDIHYPLHDDEKIS